MSNFDQRWQRLLSASRAAPELRIADPPLPMMRYPLGQPARSPSERRGLWAASILAASAWLLACALWPAAAESTIPASSRWWSHAVPALPHPPPPTQLLSDAYVTLTASSTHSKDPHL